MTIAGTAAQQAADALRAPGCDSMQSGIVAPDALWVARLAMSAPEPDTIPRPLYLRPPDARLPAPPL
jgi:tRNA threonylcarbamoyladenosine biosynthesis protein TsaB